MSLPELAYRSRLLARQVLNKWKIKGSGAALYSVKRSVSSISFCRTSPDGFSDFLKRVSIAAEPQNLLRGYGFALGFEWQWRADRRECWHLAPDTGQRWPAIFYGDIPHAPGNPYGDIRVAWEPNRLQHLLALALIYHGIEDSEPQTADIAARLVVEQLRSWWRENPPLIGIHYKSVMECGLRILCLCHAMDLIRRSPRCNEDSWRTFLNIIYSHARIIEERLSLYSSLGNHTIAESAGLLYAGILFPEFREANRWKRRALELLESESAHQILPDGSGAEQATWYLRFVLDLLGCVRNLLSITGHTVPDPLNSACERGLSFLASLEFDQGRFADMGDRDDGWALLPYRDRILLFGSNKEQGGKINRFPAGGCIVCDFNNSKVIFDHGPLGMAPSYGHGHADALSIQYFMDQSPVLMDTGTYCYNCQEGWREYFRSSAAHNVVIVDGCDQAKQQTPFMWSEPPEAELILLEESADGIMALARHDGYRRLSAPVEHLRGLFAAADGSIMVWDLLRGKGCHKLALHWHIGPEWKIAPMDGGFELLGLKDKKLRLLIKLMAEMGKTPKAVPHLFKGSLEPRLGWYAPVYGRRKPIFTIQMGYEGDLPCEFLTILASRDEGGLAMKAQHILDRMRSYAYEA